LTAHFIDDSQRLHKRILNFCSFAGDSGELIGRSVEKCLLDWGIKRVMSLTVDNARSNDLVVSYLRKRVNNLEGNVLNGEFLHIRCAVHILNLVVREGLKDIDAAITRVRAAIRYVRSSPAYFKSLKHV